MDGTPTAERLRHAELYDTPHIDQKTQRRSFVVFSRYETMAKTGQIPQDEARAAAKLHRHWLGSHGVDVGDGASGDPFCGDGREFANVYHGQKMAEAKTAIRNVRQWRAVMALIEETKTPEVLGREWLGCKQRGQAHIAGLALIRMGLEQLVDFWGLRSGVG